MNFREVIDALYELDEAQSEREFELWVENRKLLTEVLEANRRIAELLRENISLQQRQLLDYPVFLKGD